MNVYFDYATGRQHRIKPGRAAALREIDRYNALSAAIEQTERRLVELNSKRETARTRAFAALPEGAGIIMGERFELREREEAH